MGTTEIQVLHVDDDNSFLSISKSILEDEGPFSVDTASSVDEALTKIATKHYDVIVSDYEMPQKTGLDFLKKIRATDYDTPFILFTGKGREEIVVQALNLGTDRYVDKHGNPQVVYTELSVAIRQLYDKSQSKRLLWESEERFKTMVTNINGIIMLTGKDGVVLYISPSVKGILGYEPNEVIGTRPWRFVYYEDSQRMKTVADQILSIPGFSGSSEYRLTTKQGQICWVNHSYSQILQNGEIKQIVSVINDITERKKAEEAIKESGQKFSAAFHSSGAALCFTRVRDGLLIDANECFLDLYGYSREEVIGKTVNELQLYATPKDREEIVELSLNNRPVINIELRGRRKDGTIVTNLFSTKAVDIKGEKYFLSTIIDITTLKKTQATLSSSQKQLEDFITMVPNAVTLTDINGKIVYNNELASISFGIPTENVVGMHVGDFVLDTEKEEMFKALKSAALTDQAISRTFHAKRRNGELFPVDGSAKALRDASGAVTGFIIITKDITESVAKEKQIMELLQDSEKRESNIKDMLALSEIILRNTDIETALERILTTFKRIFDADLGIITLLEAEKIPGITIHNIGQKVFKQMNRNPIGLVDLCDTYCKDGKPVFFNNIEKTQFVNAVGRMPYPIPKNAIIIPLKMKGQIAGYTILSNKENDFTEIDLMSAALLAGFAQIALENNAAIDAVANSEKQLRVITDSAMDAIVMLDSNATISFWSPAAEKMFGYSFQEILGKDFHKTFAPTKYFPLYEKGLRVFTETGQGSAVRKTLELIAKRKNGEEFPIELSLSTLKSGTSWKAVGIIRDISERKKTEQKLRESEERYRFVAEHANDIITVTDANGVFRYVSPSILSLIGVEAAELVGKRSVLEFLTPEIINDFTPKLAELVQTGHLPPLQFQFNTPKGLIWLETNVSVVRDETGQLTFNGISRDITTRKLIEQKLRESEERYRFVADFAQDLVTISDLDGNYYFVSPSVEHLLGYKPEEIVGKMHVLDNFHPDDIENFRKHIRALAENKDLPPVEFRFRAKNGEYIWLEAKISTVQDSSITKFIGISRNVTQRNKDREELDKALSQAELLLEKLTVVGGFVRHDIRNKLTNITSALYLGKRCANNQEILTQIDRIDVAVKSMVRILNFSQTYEAVGNQGLSWIKIVEAITDAQAMCSGIKDLELEYQKLEYSVLADSALTEIFHNLLDNSLKYSEQSVTKVKIYSETTSSGDLRVVYQDNGKGIDDKIKPVLFKKGAGKGTGLGLYLIKRVCDVYGWTVEETGVSGQGVRFIIDIPQRCMKPLAP